MMRIVALLVTLLALSAAPSRAQDVQVEARLSAASTRAGQPVVLEITVRTGGARPESIELAPLPDGLGLGATSDATSLEVAFPGGTRRTLMRRIVLVPERPGQYRIGPATVQVGQQVYRTRPVDLVVGGTGGAAADGTAETGGEAVLEGRLLPDTVFVGQQATFRAEVRFSADASRRLRRAPEYQPPAAPGFWIQDLPDADAVGTRSIGSQIHEVRTFHRAFFPLEPGRYVIPPARLFYEVRRGFLSAPDSRELATDSLALVVLPLPAEGRPEAFTGAVGRFRVRAELSHGAVAAGEGALLTLVAEGEGNLKTLPPPTLPAIAGVRVDVPTERSDTRTGSGVVGGTKWFTWTLVPERAGRLEIPPIAFVSFDPESRAYRVDSVPVPALEVRPGADVATGRQAAPGLAAIETAPASARRLGWVRSRAFLLAQLLPLLGLAAAVLMRRAGAARKSGRRKRHAEHARRLDALRGRSELEDSGWVADLGILFRDGLADLLGVGTIRAATTAEVEAVLRRKEVDAEWADEAGALLGDLDRARYRPDPVTPAERARLLDRAEAVLRGLESATRPRRRGRGGAGVAAAVLLGAGVLLAGTAPADGAQRAEAPELFADGVAAFQHGRHEDAARAFAAYVEVRPDDPHGWFDLGNSYERAGRRGRAAWAWSRALLLDPRHQGALQNLRTVDPSGALLGRVAAWPRLRFEELLLLASLAWFGAAAAAGTFLFRRTRGAAVAGAVAVAGLVAALAGWGAPRLGGRDAVVLDPGAAVLAAPVLRADTLARPEPGSLVRVRERRGGWARITDLGGVDGWIEASRVGPLDRAPP